MIGGRKEITGNTDRRQKACTRRRTLRPCRSPTDTQSANYSTNKDVREAVKLDGANQDPYAAVQNYSQSIALLDEVLESVAAGADGSDAHKRQRAEEEARRLKSIVSSFMLCSVPIYLFYIMVC